MPLGGKRPGAGRPRGSLNWRTREAAAAIAASGSPIAYLCGVMNDPQTPVEWRIRAAESLLPYTHPRLSPTPSETPASDPGPKRLVIELVRPEPRPDPKLIDGKLIDSVCEPG